MLNNGLPAVLLMFLQPNTPKQTVHLCDVTTGNANRNYSINILHFCLKCKNFQMKHIANMFQIYIRIPKPKRTFWKTFEMSCYFGDLIGAVEEQKNRQELKNRRIIKNWLLDTLRGVSLKVYRACIQSVLGYASETWAMKVEDMARMERTKRMMVNFSTS